MYIHIEVVKDFMDGCLSASADDLVYLLNTYQEVYGTTIVIQQSPEEVYDAYCKAVDYKNFRGDPVPAFKDLPEKIQAAWKATTEVNLK